MNKKNEIDKILVVDDTPSTINILRDTLESEGYYVYVATNGEKALKRAEQAVPDLILLDVLMTGMDGFETCWRLKNNEKTKEIPVIFMTALADIKNKVKGFEVGGVDYLTKPIEIEEVLARVKTHMTLNHMYKQMETQNRQLHREISERKRVEKEIRKLNAELEQRVEERTTRLKEINLKLEKDIARRKQAEEEILKLSLSVEQSPALIVITDFNGNIEYVNRKFIEVTGYSLEEVKGENPRILKSGETPKKEYKKLWDAITAGSEWRGEFHNKKKNGELYWESAIISPIKNKEGEITHFLAVKEDVTEFRQLQQQLLQSQKMESIGTLAGGIAHDFNNLLTIINGHAEFALMKLKKNKSVNRNILSIKNAGEKAQNLTRQLLTFSRKQVYTPTILDINQVITGLEKMMLRLIGEDIDINMSLNPDIGPIKADPGQIEQILINLIVNARDAINERTEITAQKKVTIETSQVFLDESFVGDHIGSHIGLHVLISVSDSGIGMDEELKNKIFEPFFTTKGKDKGTGLGLSTVYGIVKQNQGSIFVYSEVGHGTTIKIYWPSSEQEFLEVSDNNLESKIYRGNEIILIVEDDRELKELAAETLRTFGYNVYNASNGKDALQLLKTKKLQIDLLLSDLVMPKMGGKELLEIVKKEHPTAKILFTSGYTDKHISGSGQLAAGVHFLQKPYSLQELTSKVREVLDLPGGNVKE